VRAGRGGFSTISDSHPGPGRRAAIAQPIAAPFAIAQPQPFAISTSEPVAVSQSEPVAAPFAVCHFEPAAAPAAASPAAAATTPPPAGCSANAHAGADANSGPDHRACGRPGRCTLRPMCASPLSLHPACSASRRPRQHFDQTVRTSGTEVYHMPTSCFVATFSNQRDMAEAGWQDRGIASGAPPTSPDPDGARAIMQAAASTPATRMLPATAAPQAPHASGRTSGIGSAWYKRCAALSHRSPGSCCYAAHLACPDSRRSYFEKLRSRYPADDPSASFFRAELGSHGPCIVCEHNHSCWLMGVAGNGTTY